MSWSENPFESLNKVPQAYDQTGTVMMKEMDDSDWIYTGEKVNNFKHSYCSSKKRR